MSEARKEEKVSELHIVRMITRKAYKDLVEKDCFWQDVKEAFSKVIDGHKNIDHIRVEMRVKISSRKGRLR